MQRIKKNTVPENSFKKKKRVPATIHDDVWFPEKLAKVNALLDKAILLPPHNRKVKKNK